MSDSVWPQRWQPTRFPSLGFSRQEHWVSCHFLLQCMKVKSESEVAQSCSTLRDPIDCSLPGSSTQGIFQATVLEWGAIAFSDVCLYIKIISILQIKLEILWILYPVLGPNNPRSLVGGSARGRLLYLSSLWKDSSDDIILFFFFWPLHHFAWLKVNVLQYY